MGRVFEARLFFPSPRWGEGPGVRGPPSRSTRKLAGRCAGFPSPLTPLPSGERGTRLIDPMTPTPTGRVTLKPRQAQPFFGRHPWLFAGAIHRIDGDPADAAVVDVYSSAGDFVARGLFNSKSKIRVRLYSWDPDSPPRPRLFKARLERAVALRHEVLHRNTGPNAASGSSTVRPTSSPAWSWTGTRTS